MKTKGPNNIMQNNIFRIALGTALILLVPFIAMQFTDEVNWDETDFIVVGILLLGAGLAYELITKRMNKKYRVAIAVALTAVILLLWIDLAVGIFGIPGFSGS